MNPRHADRTGRHLRARSVQARPAARFRQPGQVAEAGRETGRTRRCTRRRCAARRPRLAIPGGRGDQRQGRGRRSGLGSRLAAACRAGGCDRSASSTSGARPVQPVVTGANDDQHGAGGGHELDHIGQRRRRPARRRARRPPRPANPPRPASRPHRTGTRMARRVSRRRGRGTPRCAAAAPGRPSPAPRRRPGRRC